MVHVPPVHDENAKNEKLFFNFSKLLVEVRHMQSKAAKDLFSVNVSLQILNLKDYPQALPSAARLQCAEWGKSEQNRIDRIKRDLENPSDFPLHLIISTMPTPSNNENKKLDPKSLFVIGHAKMSKSHHVKHGYSGIVYDVVIDQRFRGLGLGYKLMLKMEEVALQNGITYLYLSTHSAVSFYEKLGYKQRAGDIISDLRSNAKRLNSSQIKKLEVLIASKLKKYHDSTDSDLSLRSGHQTVWFTKRLCRLIAPQNHDLKAVANGITKRENLSIEDIQGFCVLFPFIEQVGPCCAFGAMANIEYFMDNYRRHRFRYKSFGDGNDMKFIEGIHELDDDENIRDFALTLKSRQILNDCMASGVCLDGEMMDLNALHDVLECGFDDRWTFDIVNCDSSNFQQFVDSMNRTLSEKVMEQFTFLVVPYDKDHCNYPRVRQRDDGGGGKHAEMDAMDMSHDQGENEKLIGDINDVNNDGMVASSAHYAVICGAFWEYPIEDKEREEKLDDGLIGIVSTLIESIDSMERQMQQLRLIYMTSS